MSVALEEWRGPSSLALDEIELLYWQVEFIGAGGPALTEQVNHHYVTQLVAHFQRYCRAIHAEAAEALATIADPDFALVIEGLFSEGRLLDRRNPTPTALGSDFGRFGFRLGRSSKRMTDSTGDARSSSKKSANGATGSPTVTCLESGQRASWIPPI